MSAKSLCHQALAPRSGRFSGRTAVRFKKGNAWIAQNFRKALPMHLCGVAFIYKKARGPTTGLTSAGPHAAPLVYHIFQGKCKKKFQKNPEQQGGGRRMCAKNTKISAACGRFSGISRDMFLPFTFWTDLRYKEPPFVEVTEGGVFMSINWNLTKF